MSVVNLQLNNFGVSNPKDSDEKDGGSPRESGDDIGDLAVVTWKGAPEIIEKIKIVLSHFGNEHNHDPIAGTKQYMQYFDFTIFF